MLETPATDWRVVRAGLMLAAIEAIADGRFAEAARLVGVLQQGATTIMRGRCRYCGCTDLRGCAIVVPGYEGREAWTEPTVVSCSWVDAEVTVCSNLVCLNQWQRDQPAAYAQAEERRIILP